MADVLSDFLNAAPGGRPKQKPAAPLRGNAALDAFLNAPTGDVAASAGNGLPFQSQPVPVHSGQPLRTRHLPPQSLSRLEPPPRQFAELTDEVVGRTSEGRNVFADIEGGQSSERTRSVAVPPRAKPFVNIPTIFDGVEVSEDRAAEIMKANDFVDPETGRKLEFFDTMDAAIRAADARSKSIKVNPILDDIGPLFPDDVTPEDIGPPVLEATDQGRLQSGISAALQGVGQTVAGIPQGAAIAFESGNFEILGLFDRIDKGEDILAGGGRITSPEVQLYLDRPDLRGKLRKQVEPRKTDPRETGLWKAGEALNKFVKSKVPVNPEFEGEFNQIFAQGLGSGIGFLMFGGLGRAAKVAPAAVPALAGSTLQASAQFEEALRKGASFEDAFTAAKLGSIVGSSEAIPIARIFQRYDRASGGGLRRIILEGLGGGGEETLQETFQAVGDALIAAKIVKYDPERGIFTGVGEQAGVGFGVGALLSTVAAMSGARLRLQQSTERSELEDRAMSKYALQTAVGAFDPRAGGPPAGPIAPGSPAGGQISPSLGPILGEGTFDTREPMIASQAPTGDLTPPADVSRETIDQVGIPSSASLAGEAPGALPTSSNLAPPISQELDAGDQVSTRPVPSASLTTRETPPATDEGGITTRVIGDIDKPSGKKIIQSVPDINTGLQRAGELQAGYAYNLEAIAGEFDGARLTNVRTKDEPGMREKAANRAHDTLSDYLGGRIWVQLGDVDAVVDRIGAQYPIVEAEDFRANAGKGGYRAVHLQVQLADDFTAELQIVPEPIGVIQDVAHALYAQIKRFDPAGATSEQMDRVVAIHARIQTTFDRAWEGRQAVAPEDIAGPQQLIATPAGNVPSEMVLVEADDLLASHTDDFTPTKGYPKELQPRDRSKAATQQQVLGIANNLNPVLLGPSAFPNDGAPIIGRDHLVDSGNARVMALRRLYNTGHENATAYRDHLMNLGFTGARDMTAPILVRRYTQPMTFKQRIALANAATEGSGLTMSEAERAAVDARSLTVEVMAAYQGGEITAAGNRDFLRAYLATFSDAEQGAMRQANGGLTQAGVRRIENAIFARAYGDPALLATLRENPDVNIKGIGTGMLDAAPRWAQLRAGVGDGSIPAPLDVTTDLIAAVRLVQKARADGEKVADMASQADAFGGGLTPDGQKLLRLLFQSDDLKRQASGMRIGERLEFYAAEAGKAQAGPSLIPSDVTPGAVLDLAIRRGQGDMLLDARPAKQRPEVEAEKAPEPWPAKKITEDKAKRPRFFTEGAVIDDIDAASDDAAFILEPDEFGFEWRLAQVPIADIVVEGALTPAGDRLEAARGFIAEAGGDASPILTLLRPDGRVKLLDGAHRLKALEETGAETVPAFVGAKKSTDPEIAGTDRPAKITEADHKPKAPTRKKKPPKNKKISSKRPPAKSAKVAKGLRTAADKMQNKIDADMNPSIAEQNPTPRRARIARSMRERAERAAEIQAQMRGLADLHENGVVPPQLAGITSRGQLELLRRTLGSTLRQTMDAKDLAALKRAGITSKDDFTKAAAAVKQIEVAVSQPAVAQRAEQEIEQELLGLRRQIPGFFQTPTELAARMVEQADIDQDMDVLEPSAGAGRIAMAIRDGAPGARLSVNEINATLVEFLKRRGFEATSQNFMDMTGNYDRILMNPPFEHGQDMDHVRHAYAMLRPGGRLVTIMGEGAFFRENSQSKDFRLWLEGVGGSNESLPPETFKREGTTVKSQLVVIDKPQVDVTDLVGDYAAGMSISHINGNLFEQHARAMTMGDAMWDWTESNVLAWYMPLGGLARKNEYISARGLALGQMTAGQEVADRISTIFRAASAEDRQAIYEFMTDRDADPTTISPAAINIKRPGIGKVSVELRKAAIMVKRLIRLQGRSLVARGLLPQESFEKYRDEYLPRLYMKHLADMPLLMGNGGQPVASIMGYLMARKDLDAETREIILGEIKDPAFLASFGYATVSRDMAVLDFLNKISGNPDWVYPEVFANWRGQRVTTFWLHHEAIRLRKQATAMQSDPDRARRMRELAEEMEQLAGDTDKVKTLVPNDFRQMPDTNRYGKLRGMFVHKVIYNDVTSGQFHDAAVATIGEKIFGVKSTTVVTKGIQLWKLSKVALNPPTQVRNFVSNGVLANLAGVRAHRMIPLMIRAAHSMATNGEDWRRSKKWGIKESTFAANELIQFRQDLIRISSQMPNHSLSMGARLRMAGQAIANFGGDTYQLSEGLWKTVVMMDAIENQGMSEAQAHQLAQEALFDYSLVPSFVRLARVSPIGLPFITFYYKAAPFILKTAITHPTRFAPYTALPYALWSLLAYEYDVEPEDIDALRELLPEWIRDAGHALILPWKDELGRWQAWDFSYLMPWGMFYAIAGDIEDGDLKAIVDDIGWGTPVTDILTAFSTNTDPFYGDPIVDPTDPTGKQLADMMFYGWRLMMPSWTDFDPENGHGLIAKILKRMANRPDKFGRPGKTTGQIVASGFGINITPIETEVSRDIQESIFRREIRDIDQSIGVLMRRRDISREDKDAQRATKIENIRRVQEEIKEFRAKTNIPEALRTETLPRRSFEE